MSIEPGSTNCEHYTIKIITITPPKKINIATYQGVFYYAVIFAVEARDLHPYLPWLVLQIPCRLQPVFHQYLGETLAFPEMI